MRVLIEDLKRNQHLPLVLPPSLVEWVKDNLTPADIVFGTEFDWEPIKIHPYDYTDFDSLLAYQKEIQYLHLLPVKWPADREFYHQHRDEFVKTIVEPYKQDSLVIAPNLFLDALPCDVCQYILWVRDADTNIDIIAEFIAQFMYSFSITTSDIIFYERPLNTNRTMIRGTVKNYRHIHLLVRNKIRKV